MRSSRVNYGMRSSPPPISRAALATFLVLTFASSAVFWWLIMMVVALSFPLAWLRLRSGSFWPAALLHASHNLFIQAFLDSVTVDTGSTYWFTTEFGAALAIAVSVTAWIFWRERRRVEGASSSRAAEPAMGVSPA